MKIEPELSPVCSCVEHCLHYPVCNKCLPHDTEVDYCPDFAHKENYIQIPTGLKPGNIVYYIAPNTSEIKQIVIDQICIEPSVTTVISNSLGYKLVVNIEDARCTLFRSKQHAELYVAVYCRCE